MSSELPPELRGELLDDFYAECDELLTAVRAGLTQLEGREKKSIPEREVLDQLFRSTHSLKGNAAIVGLRPAEQVAHGMEEVFRALAKRDLALNDAILGALIAGALEFEKIVTAHRMGRDLPEIREVSDHLAQFLPLRAKGQAEAPIETALLEAPPPDPVAAARDRGLLIYHASFAPSQALDRRGLNVKSVRERLSGLGEILRAVPLIREKGSIVFEFVMGLREAPADLSPWEADGIRLVPEGGRADIGAAAETAAAGGSDPSDSSSLAPSHIVRVDLARLDELMRITGEMVIHRSRLEERLQESGGAYAGLKEITLGLSRSLREMREAITRARMVPIAEIFTRMPFVVRDLMRGSEKKARVALEGNATEVDKYLVERLREPLLHMVRNAFVHAVESPAERATAGKAAEATITLRAKSTGESVVIQIRDDGRGIDAASVVARAAALGLDVPAQADAAGVLDILCTPGFSTRDEADMAAGRGVGMAVVANTVRELGGILTFETWLGAGTEFTLKLPLTLSIAEAIIVTVGGETCAVPQSAVEEIIQVPAAEARAIKQSEVIPYRGGLLPLVRLRAMFGAGPAEAASLTVLVVTSDRGSTGLVIDRVGSPREIVIRPLADPLLRVPGISGATELGDGRPVLILDPNAITQGVVRPPNRPNPSVRELPEEARLS